MACAHVAGPLRKAAEQPVDRAGAGGGPAPR